MIDHQQDIRILDTICKRATLSKSPPYKALYRCYDAVLKEQGIEERHDNVLFRWLNGIAGVIDGARRTGAAPPIVHAFRDILITHGITVVDDDEEIGEPWLDPRRFKQASRQIVRRVSFDDANYEETWLSAHTQTLDVGTPEHAPLHRMPHYLHERSLHGHSRAKSVPNDKSRSARDQHSNRSPDDVLQESVGGHAHDLISSGNASISALEDRADAILDVKSIQAARQCLSIWSTSLRALQDGQAYDNLRAGKHDFRVLIKQVWDTWLVKVNVRRHKREDEARRLAVEKRLADSAFDLRRRVISQWLGRLDDALHVERQSREDLLAFRYFTRWRTVACENVRKVNLILTRKFFIRWHEISLIRRTDPDSVERMWKRGMLRRYLGRLTQAFAETDASRRRRASLQRNSLAQWHSRLEQIRLRQQSTDHSLQIRCLRIGMSKLHMKVELLLRMSTLVDSKAEGQIKTRALSRLLNESVLSARQRSFTDDVESYVQRKAFDAWRDATQSAKAASEWSRRRVLQTALTVWTDLLRVRTLSTQIDDRIKMDCLYRLTLAERLRLLQRSGNIRLANRLFTSLQQNSNLARSILYAQTAKYRQESKHRSATHVFRHIHSLCRRRDDAERIAIEFRNTKRLASTLSSWQRSATHVQMLQKWSKDAEFFVFTKGYMTLWHLKMIASKQEKRRLAYEQIREKVKTRIARSCLAAIRKAGLAVHDMRMSASLVDDGRLRALKAQSFDDMNVLCHEHQAQEVLAVSHDVSSLLQTALQRLLAHHGYVLQDSELADVFRAELDQSMLATILKRLRFAAFTTARLNDNSRMLHERLMQQRHHQMLRHLAAMVKERKAERVNETDLKDEPESPSTRPASRAAQRSSSKPTSARPQDASMLKSQPNTPAYLRTPLRGRRGHLRLLPTPAPHTPFNFIPGITTSTPAPNASTTDDTMLTSSDAGSPWVTPFERKLRAGGIGPGGTLASSLRRTVLTKSVGRHITSTGRSVRFLGSGIKINRSSVTRSDTMT